MNEKLEMNQSPKNTDQWGQSSEGQKANIIHKKNILNSDWLDAMQFRGKKVQKKSNTVQKKGNTVQILILKKLHKNHFWLRRSLVLFFFNIILQSILIGKILFKLNFFMYTIDK